MAEMEVKGGGGHKKGPGVKKGKKLSTRVDLTPMVDLGFLLISFFIFTTSLASPTAMKLVIPADAPVSDHPQTSEERTLTLLIAKDNRLFYYPGVFSGSMREISFKELR